MEATASGAAADGGAAPDLEVAVIGSGFSGLCMGIKLREAGISDFAILEKDALSRPAAPPVPGLARFQGRVFHSAHWDHDYDLRGKRVAVIGTGASAIQFVPAIAGQVAQLDLYQRTAPWVLPRPDRAITAVERWLLRRVPPLRALYRGLTYARYEARLLAFAKWPWLMRAVEWHARRHIARQIPHDAALRARVTPDYRAGCKRLLLSSNYYPALARPNVEVVADGIAEVRAAGVLGRDGLEAYKGAAIPGFPNLYMIIGPNTGLGHNSMIYMIEANVRYVVQALALRRARGLRAVEVRADASRRYNDALQRRLRGTVWSSGCKSWYLTGGGRNSTLWPGFTFEYRRITRRFDSAAYRLEAAA